ncbi:unnamed protein product [Allacma fusca]|uniref:non-specific protein-tyrosine kinase n=1 Tax=Allacma fusca TaxID=39272 RepID=A0A8J2KCE9_9HEXA|nr:unnamed protein product [Allacma fusca]
MFVCTEGKSESDGIMSDDEGSNWLLSVLKETQLEQFHIRLRDELQITRLEHFDHVEPDDLEKIGMGRPGARRLLETVKKRRAKHKSKVNLIDKLILGSVAAGSHGKLNSKSSSTHSGSNGVKKSDIKFESSSSSITCLINNKDLELGRKLGDGSFGVVLKADWRTPSGRQMQVAVKVLKQEGLNYPGVLADFVKEVESMHHLSHPNLIR